MAYNPPVPSDQISVFRQNAENTDKFVNSNAETFIDRGGFSHLTIRGIENLAEQAVLNAGFIVKGTFAAGATLDNFNDVIQWTTANGGSGEYYRWGGTLPKIVPPASTPASTGGFGNEAWILAVSAEGLLNQVISYTVAEFKSETANILGRRIQLTDRDNWFFDVVDIGLVIPNDMDIIANASNTLAAVLSLGSNGIVSLKSLGGDESGVDSALFYIHALSNDLYKGVKLSPKTYDFDTPVDVVRDSGFLTKGAGIGKTLINYNHFDQGIFVTGNGTAGDFDSYVTGISFEDFSVARPDYESYTGTIGPKSIYASFTKNSHILRIEEQNAIGFGLQFDRGFNVRIAHCYVHDHFGGAAGPTGTDGIHFYRCHKYIAEDNTVERVGDDTISSGSFETDPNQQAVDGIYYNNTSRESDGGGAKVYSFARNIKIYGNTFEKITNGGVYLTNDANAPDGSIVEDIDIFDNEFNECGGDGGNISGVFRIRLWNGAGTETARIRNVKFHDNKGEKNRNIALSNSFDANKYPEDIYIYDNEFSEFERLPTATGGTEFGIFFVHCKGRLVIRDTIIDDSLGYGIYLESQNGSYNPDWSDTHVTIDNVSINNYGTVITGSRGIFSRPNNKRMTVDLIGNKVFNQNVADGQEKTNAILTGGNINPKSVVEGNQFDDTSSGISIGSSAPSAFKGDISNKWAGTAPSAGTHYRRSRISNNNTTNGEPSVFFCSSSGTFGTLIGVTASTTSGSKVVTMSDASSLAVGEVLTIGTSFTSAEIRSIDGNAVVMSVDASASESGVTVNYSAPSFKAESVWADI